MNRIGRKRLTLAMIILLTCSSAPAQELRRLQYNNPGLVVDLGVGLWAWPMPMDWDDDGDLDLIVSCPDKPYSGTYFFENREGPKAKLPIFQPGVRVGAGRKNLQVSYVNGVPRVLDSNREFAQFLGKSFDQAEIKTIYPKSKIFKTRGNQRFNVWSYVDYDGDGRTDVMVGLDDWGYYGWDDGFDARGNWKRGPLHGLVFILPNEGTEESPRYGEPLQLEADGKPINVYGNPMPNMADFDGDGDLDLICGEFLDGFTYFENRGTLTKPVYRSRGYLEHAGEKISMHVQMITPTAIDWDNDGDVDLIVGDEDGRVALVENLGAEKGVPKFSKPQYFSQFARDLKFGALVTPVAVDWDSDGDEDLVCGNTSGNIAWFENMSSEEELRAGKDPIWSAPQLIEVDGKPFRIMAGENGSIQGPAEEKWGYTTLSVADWDDDGLLDIVINSIWGRVDWLHNVGDKRNAKLEAPKPVRVDWKIDTPKPSWTWWVPNQDELATQWRTTPAAIDWNADGLTDLVMLDHKGYLSFFERVRREDGLWLMPGKRIFKGKSYDSRQREKPGDGFLRLNTGSNGGSGRRKFCFVDWDHDGDRDLLVNSVNAHWLRAKADGLGAVDLAGAQLPLVARAPAKDLAALGRRGAPEIELAELTIGTVEASKTQDHRPRAEALSDDLLGLPLDPTPIGVRPGVDRLVDRAIHIRKRGRG